MWNYRIAKEKIKQENQYSVRETYYNDKGEIYSINAKPQPFICETKSELKDSLEKAMKAFSKPVIDLDIIVFATPPWLEKE